MWPTGIDSSEMTAIYSVANTAPYLFKHLRRLGEVERLGKRTAAAELAALVAGIVGQEQRTPTDIARAYASLVAMTFRAYEEWRAIIDSLDLRVLDWGEAFRHQMKTNAVPTVVTELRQLAGTAASTPTLSLDGATHINADNRPQIIKLVSE
jgi:hypothetical protein